MPSMIFVDAGHAQRLHAAADRLGLDLGRRGALEHQLLERSVNGMTS